MRYYQNIAFLFIAFTLSLFLYSCQSKETVIERGYYFWQNKSYLGSAEKKFLQQHSIHKLYAKILDVDWNDVYGPVPASKNDLNEINGSLNIYDSLHINIVPVVFITNKTFQKIDSGQLHLLALRILKECMLDAIDIDAKNNGTLYSVKKPASSEIQFDCDWTESTSGKYFQFLKEVKRLLPDSVIVSATIRLHQYKYPSQTGVPPVNRGMLMLYNIDDPKKYESTNSIFDYDKAKAYFTSGKEYKLPLDVVLPAFSWSLVFRNGKFYQIENNLSENDLMQLNFLQKQTNGFYRVNTDTVFNDLFLRIGDEIKPEAISTENLDKAAELAHKAINSKKYSVAFFDLSEDEVKEYDSNEIDKIYNSF